MPLHFCQLRYTTFKTGLARSAPLRTAFSLLLFTPSMLYEATHSCRGAYDGLRREGHVEFPAEGRRLYAATACYIFRWAHYDRAESPQAADARGSHPELLKHYLPALNEALQQPHASRRSYLSCRKTQDISRQIASRHASFRPLV